MNEECCELISVDDWMELLKLLLLLANCGGISINGRYNLFVSHTKPSILSPAPL